MGRSNEDLLLDEAIERARRLMLEYERARVVVREVRDRAGCEPAPPPAVARRRARPKVSRGS
jgi:hypothetical protein